jgi:hypothetical protein
MLVDAGGAIGTHPQEQKFLVLFFKKRTASFALPSFDLGLF